MRWPTLSAGDDAHRTDLDALKVERDENDQRKEPTISEKVALAEAIAERLGQRQGQRTDLATCGNISTSEEAGQKTRDIAASKAGLGSGKTRSMGQGADPMPPIRRGAFSAHLTAEKHNKRQHYTMLQVVQIIDYIALVCCALLCLTDAKRI